MKPYHDQLLAFVQALTDADAGQMTLDRIGPHTYPDPAKTSYNDSVQWRIKLMFGRGYFSGAVVTFKGDWSASVRDRDYNYAEGSLDLRIEEAVNVFLSDSIPDWVVPIVHDKKGKP